MRTTIAIQYQLLIKEVMEMTDEDARRVLDAAEEANRAGCQQVLTAGRRPEILFQNPFNFGDSDRIRYQIMTCRNDPFRFGSF